PGAERLARGTCPLRHARTDMLLGACPYRQDRSAGGLVELEQLDLEVAALDERGEDREVGREAALADQAGGAAGGVDALADRQQELLLAEAHGVGDRQHAAAGGGDAGDGL